MSDTTTDVWVLDPAPNGLLHRCVDYHDGPANTVCGQWLPPRHVYRERPSVIPVCRRCTNP